jgi:DNA-binding CsgD family transcriptional regulator
MSPSSGEGNLGADGRDWRAEWFERDPTARLVVARDLTVIAANRSAFALLERREAIAIREGLLSSKDRTAAAHLADAVVNAEAGSRLDVIGSAGDGAGVVIEARSIDGRPDGPVALTLRDLNGAPDIVCADLEAMFGVTHGEHQVVIQLLKGYSSREIAAQSGKSILTIRTHVKRAYGKIGVTTRGQLFARLLPYLCIR